MTEETNGENRFSQQEPSEPVTSGGEKPVSPEEEEQTPTEEASETEAPDAEEPAGAPRTTFTPTEPPKKKKKELHLTAGAVALLVVCCLVVSILAGAGANYLFFNGSRPAPQETTEKTPVAETTSPTKPAETTAPAAPVVPIESNLGETAPGIAQGTEEFEHGALAKTAQACLPSVVIIEVTETTNYYGQEYTSAGAGSGVIYTKDGYIITNYHVVGKDTKSIKVTLSDGTQYEGAFIYGDEYSDISVIKINKNDCVPAKIGSSAQIWVLDETIAIGNSLGLGIRATYGVISALACDVTVENLTMNLMSTDAGINSGNSGGGLFNARGELIGIVNAKIGGTSVESMGYAIPIDAVVKCVNDMNRYGYVTGKARLGVTVQTKTYQSWPYLQTYTLLQIAGINPNGSAASSGMQVDDILQKLGDTEISSFEDLQRLLTKYEVGDTVTLTVRRPTIGYTGSNLSEYLNSCEEVKLEVTFVEFNPNVS